MSQGIAVEVEELGRVALISALLVPGLAWVANGNGSAAKVRRSLLIGGVIAAALGLEAILDRNVNAVADSVE